MIRYLPAITFAIVSLSGCLGPVKELYPENEEERPIPVYIVSHGWHVGIAMEAASIQQRLPEHPGMPDAAWFKFGWGDNRYYPHPDPGFGLLLRAALLPTRSVIHVVGMDIPVEQYFRGSDIIKIQVSEEGAEKLAQFIADRFRRNGDGEVQFAAEGLYGNSAFYEAAGRYYIPKTSNTWTARALRQTGYPITPVYAITSGNVIQQARKDGKRMNIE